MREIGPPKPDPDPGECFYTIRKEDAGKTVIDTEIGRVSVAPLLGTVLKQDIGKRLYRLRDYGGDWQGAPAYAWQAENNAQFRKRKEAGQ